MYGIDLGRGLDPRSDAGSGLVCVRGPIGGSIRLGRGDRCADRDTRPDPGPVAVERALRPAGRLGFACAVGNG